MLKNVFHAFRVLLKQLETQRIISAYFGLAFFVFFYWLTEDTILLEYWYINLMIYVSFFFWSGKLSFLTHASRIEK